MALLAITVGLGAAGGRAAAAGGGGGEAGGAAAGPGSTLITRYPLGRRRLCCTARTSRPATARPRSDAGAPRASRPAPVAHGLSPLWIAAAVAAAAVAVMAAFLSVRTTDPARRRWRPAGSPFAARAARLPRPRRLTPPWVLVVLSPLMRYSAFRDAYVLRLVGGRHGPVLVTRPPAQRPPPRPAAREPSQAGRP